MSATNRGGKRRAADFYETPGWLSAAIMPILKNRLPSGRALTILEPASGAKAMVRVLADSFPGHAIHDFDLHGNPPTDFLELSPDPRFDLIITNPPYSLAMDFIKQALRFRRDENSIVAMLLRVNFLGSRKRAKWLRSHPPAVYVTPRRPTFTNDGKTDATEYAWFLWQEPLVTNTQVAILETEDLHD